MKKLCALLVLGLLAPAVAGAAPITSLVVVGDSLSDQGNAFILTGGFPPPPYAQRASNGPTAAERLAQRLGVTLTASEAGGTNYAVVGATTGPVAVPSGTPPFTENVAQLNYNQPALAGTSLLSQTLEILSHGPITDPDGTLFMVWGGANDLFLNPSIGTAVQAVTNLTTIIGSLYGAGARQFLVPNLPDLSSTPAGQALPPLARAQLQALTVGFNQGLANQLALLSNLPGIEITAFDTFGFFAGVLANPGAFGFTNATTPCLTGDFAVQISVCGDPNAHVFWDSVHPTTAAHQVLGDRFAEAAVPEPATLTLLGLGLGLVTATRRRRARAQ